MPGNLSAMSWDTLKSKIHNELGLILQGKDTIQFNLCGGVSLQASLIYKMALVQQGVHQNMGI